MPSRRLFLAGGASLAATLAGCSALDDEPEPLEGGGPPIRHPSQWPSFNNHGTNTGYSPEGTPVRSEPGVAWRAPVDWPNGYPVVGEERVFYPDQNVLRAFEVDSGAERWSRVVTSAERDDGRDLGLTTPPAYLWRADINGPSPLVAVGVAGDRNELRAYTVDGELAWRTETPAGGRIVGAPAYGPLGNRLCVGTTAERLLCVDATTGDLGWSRSVFGAVTGGVAVGRGLVEAATAAGEVYGISADDGSGRWRRAIDRGTECAPALTGGLAFLADSAGTVYATSGNEEVWQNEFEGAAHSYQGVAVDEKRVYVVTEETGSDEIENLVSAVYARTGEEAWSHRLGNFSGSVPAVVDDTLYVSSGDGVVAVATGETGRFESRQRWHWRPDGQGDGPFDGPVVPADGRLFVPVSASDGGELVALE